jgi:4'-phosphopantetheinyl transferase EntD
VGPGAARRVVVIEDLLPASVVVCSARGDDGGTLAPAEESAVARAVDSRRAEFTTGRVLARAALARLGSPVDAVPVGEKRAPVWPAGVVGSITHCAGLRAAAVARTSDVRSLGIDAERARPLPDGVLDAVSDADERAWLAGLGEGAPWDAVLFSAKESVYKTWFPLTGRWLGFEDAALTPYPDGTFVADIHLPDDAVPPRLHGRWAVREGLVLTAIALPAA